MRLYTLYTSLMPSPAVQHFLAILLHLQNSLCQAAVALIMPVLTHSHLNTQLLDANYAGKALASL